MIISLFEMGDVVDLLTNDDEEVEPAVAATSVVWLFDFFCYYYLWKRLQ